MVYLINAAILMTWIGAAVGLVFMLYRLWMILQADKYLPLAQFKESAHDRTNNRQLYSDPPKVCIQLPIYNEPTQIIDLLSCISHLQWYGELEIQILDDSDDETPELIGDFLQALENSDNTINSSKTVFKHITRSSRTGYKAGALQHGMTRTDADYFCIFDADFRPAPDFVTELMNSFEPHIGAIQARWVYHNQHSSLLTEQQAIMLNHHFVNEHPFRQHHGLMFNFNGTAGIWRRQAIEDAGGWSADSICEDLHLSYRAQQKGWHLRYKQNSVCQSMLPETIPNLLVQQRRWAKGTAQVLRLMTGSLLRNLPKKPLVNIDALYHLSGWSQSLLVLALYLLSPVWIVAKSRWLDLPSTTPALKITDTGIFVLLMWTVLYFFVNPRMHLGDGTNRSPSSAPPGKGTPPPTLYKRFYLALSILLTWPLYSLFIAGSFAQGLLSKNKSHLVFERTPKSNLTKPTSKTRFSKDERLFGFFCCFSLGCSSLAFYNGLVVSGVFFLLTIFFAIKMNLASSSSSSSSWTSQPIGLNTDSSIPLTSSK